MRRIFLPVQLAAIACGVLALMACDGGSSGLMSPEDDDYTGYNRAGPVSSSGKGGAKSSSSERISSTNSSSSINSSSTINSSSGEDEGESYLSDETLNTIIDKRDGEVYRVVKIGTQVWMAENLRYHDADANSLLAKHSWCVGEEGYCRQNGYVYDFAAVVNDLGCAEDFCGILYPHRGICPEGFHVPKKAEWDTLQSNATRLNISLNAETGFTSAPTGEHGDYAKMDNCARYWTASQANSLAAYEFYRCGSETSFKSQSYSKDYGYALRCVADPGEVKVDRLVVPDESSSSLSEISSSSVESSSAGSSSSSEVYSSSDAYEESSSSEGNVSWDDLETFTDVRDGEVYRVMKVGTQVWMAENLRYTDSTETPALEGATFCWQDDPENCKTRGALYLWHAAMGKIDTECGYGYRCNEEPPVRGICPEGFHVPTSSEWYDLRQYSSSLEKELIDIPTGEVDTRYGKSFASEGAAHYWTSSEVNAQGAVTWYVSSHDISSQDFDKRMGYALRCVKNAE